MPQDENGGLDSMAGHGGTSYERYDGPIPAGCMAVYRLDGVQYGHPNTQITGAELRGRHGVDPSYHVMQEGGSEVRDGDTLYLHGIERRFATCPRAVS